MECVQDEVNQGSGQDEVGGTTKGADSTGKVMHKTAVRDLK